MNRELELYIHAVCKDAHAPKRVSIAARLTSVLSFVSEWLESIGPYCCELRPIRKVRGAIAKHCERREVIGFHGLV
jgi:hypothetical protein